MAKVSWSWLPPAQDTLPAAEQTFWAGRGELGGALLTATQRPDSPVCGGHGHGQTQLQAQAYGSSDAPGTAGRALLHTSPSRLPPLPSRRTRSIPAFDLHRLLISPEPEREAVRGQAMHTPASGPWPFHPPPSAGATFL